MAARCGVCNSSTRDAEIGGLLQVQCPSGLHGEFKDSLNCRVKLCVQQEKQDKTKQNPIISRGNITRHLSWKLSFYFLQLLVIIYQKETSGWKAEKNSVTFSLYLLVRFILYYQLHTIPMIVSFVSLSDKGTF